MRYSASKRPNYKYACKYRELIMRKTSSFLTFLKGIVMGDMREETYPIIGVAIGNTVVFVPPILIILAKTPYVNTFYDCILASAVFLIFWIMFSIPVYCMHKKYINTLIYRYAIYKILIFMSYWFFQSIFIAFLHTKFNTFVEYRETIAVVHIFIFIILTILFCTYFIKSQKKSNKLYYKKKFGVVFIDTAKISSTESEFIPDYIQKLFVGTVLPYCVIMAGLMKTKTLDYGCIFFVTAFTLFSVFNFLCVVRAAYRLLVTLPKVKHDTGSEVYADLHNILDKNPHRAKELFGAKH